MNPSGIVILSSTTGESGLKRTILAGLLSSLLMTESTSPEVSTSSLKVPLTVAATVHFPAWRSLTIGMNMKKEQQKVSKNRYNVILVYQQKDEWQYIGTHTYALARRQYNAH